MRLTTVQRLGASAAPASVPTLRTGWLHWLAALAGCTGCVEFHVSILWVGTGILIKFVCGPWNPNQIYGWTLEFQSNLSVDNGILIRFAGGHRNPNQIYWWILES